MKIRPLTLASLLAVAAVVAGACDNSLTVTQQDCAGLATAPTSQRVDLVGPAFTNPTSITNPLFPISGLGRVLLMGSVDGASLRVETTLLSGTRTIDLYGQEVATRVSQYVAWLDGRIHEVAIDWYGQDDAGAVWYFGEDVFNYEDGVITDTDGTWLAGADGPVAMIMPANPQVGHVWRPENVCGLVFEEVAVTTTGVTVNGPRGTIAGAIVTDELHMDGSREDKTFAPGYGEFSTGTIGGNLEAVALAVPVDAVAGPTPAPLTSMSADADTVFIAADVGDWVMASAAANRISAAWTAYQAGGVPPMLLTATNAAVTALTTAVAAQSPAASRRAAIAVDQASLDLQLRYRAVAEVDLALLDLWARQLLVDAAAADQIAVLGDAATLKWVRDRLAPDVGSGLGMVDTHLAGLRAAAAARDLRAVTGAAVRMRQGLAQVRAGSR